MKSCAEKVKNTRSKTLFRCIGVIVLAVALLAALLPVIDVESAFAASEVSGTCGECTWTIDADGLLTIEPTNGVSGVLASATINGNWDWGSYRSSVKKVVVKPGVVGNTSMKSMFCNLENCTEMDLSGLDTSNVTDMGHMFNGCSSLTSLDVSGFDTSKVTDMGSMFSDCSSLTELDLSGFDTAIVTNMAVMFSDCSSLAELDVSGFDTAIVTNMNSMFSNCQSLTELDVSGFDTSNVTNMGWMFNDCSSLTGLDVSGFDTAKVTFMRYMFYNCSSLTELDVSGFDTSNVTNMSWMFNSCSSLTSLDVSGFDTSNVEEMQLMFNGCSSLTSLDVSGFDTSNVTNMYGMFNGCINLTELDLSGFDTANVTDMGWMFSGCINLTELDLSGFDTANVTDMDWMFWYCTALNTYTVSPKWVPASNYSAETGVNYFNVIDETLKYQPTTGYKVRSVTIHNNGENTSVDLSSYPNSYPGFTGDVTATIVFRDKTAAVYTIIYDANGGENAPANEVKDYGEDVTLSNILPTKNGSSFLGWNTEPDGSGTGYAPGDLYTINADLTLYAQWLEDEYIAGGISGGCTWTIDADGVLTIEPTNGVSGVLASGSGSWNWGWDSYRSSISKVVVKPGVVGNTSMRYMFCNLTNCTEMDLSGLDTSNVTDMSWMFKNCSSLTELDVSGFDTANVTKMSSMFSGCSGLTELDVSGFDTAKVTNMGDMFNNCSSLTELDVSGFDTAKVTNMGDMFNNCSSLTELDVSGFDTSKVTDMSFMFGDCSGLTELDVSGFDTANVTKMSSMFSGCSGLTELDVSGFDTANVTNMGGMFSGCSGLTELDVSGFDTANVTNMGGMFLGCSSLTELDVSGFDTSKVTDMHWMFYNCSSLTELDVSSFDTANVTDMLGMFSGCSGLTELDVSGFDTANVTRMSGMFSGCSSLTELDVSGFDTANVTNMGGMFSGCSGLTELDVSGFDTANVTEMSSMFSYCSGLTELDVSGFDTANATDMGSMFRDCSGLTELDVSGFDTANVTDMGYMFNNCSSLTALDVSGFDTANVTKMSSMFEGCSSLTELDVSGFDTANVTDMSYMFRNCRKVTELDVSGFDTSKVTDMHWMFYNCSSLTELDLSSFDTTNVTDMENMFSYCTALNTYTVSPKWVPASDYSSYRIVNYFNADSGTLSYKPSDDCLLISVTIHDGGNDIPVDLTTYPESYPGFTGDVTATIVFLDKTAAEYTITWKNYDGTVLGTDKVVYGNVPQYAGDTPSKAKDADYIYTFAGWQPEVAVVSGDAEYTAVFTTEINEYGLTPKITSAASKLYEPWGIKYLAAYEGNGVGHIVDRGIVMLKDVSYTDGMTAEEFRAHEKAHEFTTGDGSLLFSENTAKYPNGVYSALLDKGIYSYDIGANYYALPFAELDNGEIVYGKTQKTTMEKILTSNLNSSKVSDEEKAICTAILALKESVAEHYAATGITGVDITTNAARGNTQTAAEKILTPAEAGITPKVASAASRLIEPWGIKFICSAVDDDRVVDYGLVMLSEQYYSASYADDQDAMRLHPESYVFIQSEGTLKYGSDNSQLSGLLNEGISSKDIDRAYYAVAYVILDDGTYVYSDVKNMSMLKIMNYNYTNKDVPQTEKNVIHDIIELYNAVKAYYGE